MKIIPVSFSYIELQLEPYESWDATAENGYGFRPRQLQYSGGQHVKLRGWAIKADGTQGLIQREVTILVRNLSKPELAIELVKAYKQMLVDELERYERERPL